MTSRVCRALSAFALFVGAVSLLPGSVGTASAQTDRPVEVGITGVSPQVPVFTDTGKKMTFSGKVLNTGSTPLKHVYLKMQRSIVTNRTDMGSAEGNDYTLPTVDPKVFSPLAPGSAQTWTFSLTENDLFGSNDPAPGVYAVDIDAFDSDSDGDFLGGKRTYVEWEPKQMKGAQQARIALMWPVVGQPGLTGQKTANNAAAPVLTDQSTAQQYAPGGRLDKILKEGQSLPTVNWLVDPDVEYTAKQLGSGYFYPDPADPDHQIGALGSDANNAMNWYNQASAVLGSAPNCWNLMYGDPDLNTLTHSLNGQYVLNAAAGVHSLTVGCRQDTPTVAWPSDGQADATTLAGIAQTKTPNLVTLVGSASTAGWPSAHASLPNSPNTVVYDNALSNIFADPAKTSASSLDDAGVLAGQMWLAQTALATREGSAALVVTPPRDFDPPQKLLSAIKAMQSVPTADQWFGLDDLGGKVLNQPTTAKKASALTKISTANLPTATVNSTWDSEQLYSSLHAIMPNRSYDSAVPFRPVATWWRTHTGGAAFGKTVYSTVLNNHGLVSFGSQTPPLTMSGKTGTVPVTIKNDTDATIVVYLRAREEGAHTMDLKVNEDQGAHSVLPGQVNTVRIPVQAKGNGQQVTLIATLYTCADIHQNCTYNPQFLSTPLKTDTSVTEVRVHVSRIGIIALGLMIGSGMLLVLLIGLRVYRAKRTHHAPAQDTMAS